jgi:hypothetical protein
MTAWKDRYPLTRFFLVFLFSTNKSNSMKNYIGFINDHSGSMASLAKAAGPVELPKVTPTKKPTKSPIPKKAKAPTPSVNGGAVKFFQSRDDARHYARAYGLSQRDLKDYPNAVVVNPEGLRWFVIL